MEVIQSNKGVQRSVLMATCTPNRFRGVIKSDGDASRGLKNCAGILQTTADVEDPSLQKEHNHAQDPTMIEVKKRLNEMKRKASDTHEKSPQIFAQVAEQVHVNYILVSLNLSVWV